MAKTSAVVKKSDHARCALSVTKRKRSWKRIIMQGKRVFLKIEFKYSSDKIGSTVYGLL